MVKPRSPAGPRRRRKRTHAVNAHIRFLRLCCFSPQALNTEDTLVCPWEPLCDLLRGRVAPSPGEGFRTAFGRISEDFRRTDFGAGESTGAFLRRLRSQQPAVRVATAVCGFWKLTLFSRLPELFDAKFEKSRRKAPCHNGLWRRFDIKSLRFTPL